MGALDEIGTTVLVLLSIWVDSSYDVVAAENIWLHADHISMVSCNQFAVFA